MTTVVHVQAIGSLVHLQDLYCGFKTIKMTQNFPDELAETLANLTCLKSSSWNYVLIVS